MYSLLTLLDDIATVLDDVSVMTKVAVRKTAGVLGDDLALNAEQVSGVRADRELPVVWAVAKGSAVNKLILVPAALAISALLPWLITPLLMLGGAYLCFEGAEKILHRFLHGEDDGGGKQEEGHSPEFEKRKIKGAIRTDFVLSAEIIVIALGTVQNEPMLTRVLVVCAIALLMTIGVYSLVAGIVKLDDLGLHLVQRPGAYARAFGRAILATAPRLMKGLSVVGTAAMVLVGGGILLHGIPPAEAMLHHPEEATPLAPLVKIAATGIAGLVAGSIVLGVVSAAQRLIRRER